MKRKEEDSLQSSTPTHFSDIPFVMFILKETSYFLGLTELVQIITAFLSRLLVRYCFFGTLYTNEQCKCGFNWKLENEVPDYYKRIDGIGKLYIRKDTKASTTYSHSHLRKPENHLKFILIHETNHIQPIGEWSIKMKKYLRCALIRKEGHQFYCIGQEEGDELDDEPSRICKDCGIEQGIDEFKKSGIIRGICYECLLKKRNDVENVNDLIEHPDYVHPQIGVMDGDFIGTNDDV